MFAVLGGTVLMETICDIIALYNTDSTLFIFFSFTSFQLYR